jgi:hypothetical protein
MRGIACTLIKPALFMALLINAGLVSADDKCRMRILSQNGGSYEMEYIVTDFVISKDQSGHSLVTIPGLSFNDEPGKPRLPVTGALLSVAAFAQFELFIVEEDCEFKTGIQILPNPTPEFKHTDNGILEQKSTSTKDMATYGVDAFYPLQPVALKVLGFMRNQYLLQVGINPAQYNPGKAVLKLNKKVRFQIKQNRPLQSASTLAKNVYQKDESLRFSTNYQPCNIEFHNES